MSGFFDSSGNLTAVFLGSTVIIALLLLALGMAILHGYSWKIRYASQADENRRIKGLIKMAAWSPTQLPKGTYRIVGVVLGSPFGLVAREPSRQPAIICDLSPLANQPRNLRFGVDEGSIITLPQ